MPRIPKEVKDAGRAAADVAAKAGAAAVDAGKVAGDAAVRGARAAVANDVVRDLVVDGVEAVAPRTAKRVEAALKRFAGKKEAPPTRPKEVGPG